MKVKVNTAGAYNASVSSVKDLPAVQAAVLRNRGLEGEAADMALSGTLAECHNPTLMKDAECGANVIAKHIRHGSHIVCYTDYDADGFGSAVVVVEAMKGLGANIDWFANSRAIGYGANPIGVAQIMDKWPDTKLVITTDNGIVAWDAIDEFVKRGVEVVVTDHHQPSADGRLPNASAVINPHRLDDSYPFKGLCGAGVAWKVMRLVYQEMGRDPSELNKLLDVVALSTVADVVPLVDENRIIVSEGLRRINSGATDVRADWDVLRKVNSGFGFEINKIDARSIAFTFAPQINACSRMLGSIEAPIEMFLSDDVNRKEELARYIKEVNLSRKDATDDQTERCFEMCKEVAESPVILVYNPHFTDGLVGLIAGRIKEAYWAPAIIMTNDPDKPGILRGSGRSIEGFPLKAILDEIQEETGLLAGFGGHDMACGLSLPKENLEAFRAALNKKAVEKLVVDDYVKNVNVDVLIGDRQEAAFVADALETLEPYGTEFEAPVVGIQNFRPLKIENIGKNKQHLKMTGKNITVISWNGWNDYVNNGAPTTASCYGRLEVKKGEIQLICDGELVIPV